MTTTNSKQKPSQPSIWVASTISLPIVDYGANFPDLSMSFVDKLHLRFKRTNAQVEGTDIVFTEEDRVKLEKIIDESIELQDHYRRFNKIHISPDALWLWSDEPPKKNQAIFKITDGYLVVNAACAAILQEFRLGNTTLKPLDVYHIGSKEKVNDEPYYFMNICEWRTFFVPEESHPKCKYLGYDNDGYKLHRMLFYSQGKNAQAYAMQREALACDIDLWHDPKLDDSICISEALRTALKKAKLANSWYLQSCKIID